MNGSLKDARITVFKDIWSKQPYHTSLSKVLDRIKNGNSKQLVERIRAGASGDKGKLPSICFSGLFEGERKDNALKTHSGLVILDFDKLSDIDIQKLSERVKTLPYVVSSFVSPSGNGLKVLVRIADGAKHRQHYRALMKEFDGLDEKNINEARVCFESYDPHIYVNYEAAPFTKYIESVRSVVNITPSDSGTFGKIEKWLQSKSEYFQSGNRNDYIFKLASACCRFGIEQEEAERNIEYYYLSKDTEFTTREMKATVNSAYRSNKFGSAKLDGERLVDVETTKEVVIEDNDGPITDVIYGRSVMGDALQIFRHGYTSAESTGIPVLDKHFKWKRKELTVLTGIGNHGKSTFLKYLMLNKTILDGTKWAIFGPEDFPAHEFYHDLTEILIGANCTPDNIDKPSDDIYELAYKYVSDHFFYIYPESISPTPEYIKSRFLRLIMVEKVSGVIIDPFNQMTNDYGSAGGRDDKYLETVLSDFTRFAIANDVYFVIVAHPHKLQKDRDTKRYECPSVFDLAGGAMWNNKADNILVYHRPKWSEDPTDRTCEFHSKKIRRQKIVGVPGKVEFEFDRRKRRFVFDDAMIEKNDIGYRPSENVKRVSNGGFNRIVKDYSTPTVADEEVPF